MIDELISQTKLIQQFCIEKIEKANESKISNNESRLLCEALKALYNISMSTSMEAHNRLLLEKTFLFTLLPSYNKLFFYAAYYYSYQKIAQGEMHEKQESFFQINVNTATMIAVIDSFRMGINEIGGSTDDHCFSRMDKVVYTLQHVFKEEDKDVYIPSLYVLFNLSQLLSNYILSGHKRYLDKVIVLKNKVLDLIQQFENKPYVTEILKENFQLRLFNDFQKHKMNVALSHNTEVYDYSSINLSELRTENKLRILTSLAEIQPELFIKLLDEHKEALQIDIERNKIGLNNFLYVSCIVAYLRISNYSEEINFDLSSLSDSQVDFTNHLDSYFSNYTASATVSLTRDELDILLKYNDDTLRSKLSSTIIGTDPHIIERESKKPHGAFEIADMEIPITIGNDKYFMCMPFKSGVEIPTPTVPVSVAYQIFRPFLHFNNCILVFISAKRCSQNLMNSIKRMQDKFRWNIVVIENEELAKLLKINGQLN